MIGMLLDAIAALFDASFRHLRRGPHPPGRALRAEILVSAIRRLMHRSKEHGIPWLREAQGRFPVREPILARVRLEDAEFAGVACLVCTPSRTSGRTLLYLHGGGYVIGTAQAYRGLIAHFAEATGARVVAPDYRLGPEHLLPAAQDDCFAVYRALLAEGVPPASLAVAGDSAGGGLTLATLLQARDAGEPLPAAGVLLCPWVDPPAQGGSLESNAGTDCLDAELLGFWFAQALGDGDPRDPRWTPAGAELAGLPPLLVQWAGAEVLADQIRDFVERLKTASVDVQAREWPAMFHDWMVATSLLPEGQEAVDDVGVFLNERLAR